MTLIKNERNKPTKRDTDNQLVHKHLLHQNPIGLSLSNLIFVEQIIVTVISNDQTNHKVMLEHVSNYL